MRKCLQLRSECLQGVVCLKNKGFNTALNLVPKKIQYYQLLKKVRFFVLITALCALTFIAALTAKGFIEIHSLNKKIDEDKKIIAAGHLDQLNALKEQYDNLILGIDSGNITLIPNIDIQMTELFSLIDKHKPPQATLTGIEGQLKSNGEYTYRMEFSSSERNVVAGFLEKLQKEKLEYINVSAITKTVNDNAVRWAFSVTVKIGGIANE